MGDWAGDIRFPRIQGADCVGRIAAVGAGVDPARIGERVVCAPYICDPDNPEWLKNAGFLGSEYDGAFALFTRLPARNAVRVADDLPFTDAQLATLPCSGGTAMNMMLMAGRGGHLSDPARQTLRGQGRGRLQRRQGKRGTRHRRRPHHRPGSARSRRCSAGRNRWTPVQPDRRCGGGRTVRRIPLAPETRRAVRDGGRDCGAERHAGSAHALPEKPQLLRLYRLPAGDLAPAHRDSARGRAETGPRRHPAPVRNRRRAGGVFAETPCGQHGADPAANGTDPEGYA